MWADVGATFCIASDFRVAVCCGASWKSLGILVGIGFACANAQAVLLVGCESG